MMASIRLYDTLRKIPDVDDGLAFKEDVATKADLEASLKKMARIVIMWMTALIVGLFIGHSAVIFSAVRILQ